MIEIHIPKFSALHREQHTHRCPLKHDPRRPETRYQVESNEICGKTLAGTGLSHHTFPCIAHVSDYRTRFGIDVFIDAFLSLGQAARFQRMWPDEVVEARERVEATNNPEIRDTLKRKDEI